MENNKKISDSQFLGDLTKSNISEASSSSSLLTSAPIQAFHDEFQRLHLIAQHFAYINAMIYTFLKQDKTADGLRRYLKPFNGYMNVFMSKFSKGLKKAQLYYCHNPEEFTGEYRPTEITEDHARILLNPEFQVNTLEHARDAVSNLNEAKEILEQHALKFLQDIERELGAFVDGYRERARLTEERSHSWLPTGLLDILWGNLIPTTREYSEVEIMPQELMNGTNILMELPGFLDRLVTHYSRLTTLRQEDLISSGYSSINNLKRLYASRVASSTLLHEITIMSWDMDTAFAHGRPDRPSKYEHQ